MTQVWPGTAYPLGATYDGTGTNFAIFSEVAEKVELCLFDDDGNEERIRLPEMDGYVWHAFLPGIQPGQRYGFRVHGPYDPGQGQRCNPNKLLLDPYAKAIDGSVDWDESVFGYHFGSGERNDDDSAPHMPKSVVVNPYFDWGVDRPPRIPYQKTVIYEAHVKGLTMTHPRIPEDIRGTYAAVAHPAIIEHLQGLGVTAIELMPVHQFVQDDTLLQKGLRNYWGYNTIGVFAPHNEYAQATDGQQVQEFKGMVRALHEAGIEVILDVVYNHTAEGNHMGPTLSFKGIDNQAYYRLVEDDEQREPAQRPAPAVAAADHGLAALLGHRDARRWLPVRPRVHPGPPVPRGRPPVGVLRPGEPGPDRQPGQADRRAVGRRRRRLPGRRLPSIVDGVERQVPGHRARLLAGRAGHARRVRVPVHRILGPVRDRRSPADRLDQLRDGA